MQFIVFVGSSKGENLMLRFLFVASLFLAVMSSASVFAMEVEDVVITTAVVEREPVDQVEVFPRQNGTLYCFTRVVGSESPTFVYHLWYRGDELMSRVQLPVNSSNWRTWSAKQLLEDWPGQWRVEIQDDQGNNLGQVRFELR